MIELVDGSAKPIEVRVGLLVLAEMADLMLNGYLNTLERLRRECARHPMSTHASLHCGEKLQVKNLRDAAKMVIKAPSAWAISELAQQIDSVLENTK